MNAKIDPSLNRLDQNDMNWLFLMKYVTPLIQRIWSYGASLMWVYHVGRSFFAKHNHFKILIRRTNWKIQWMSTLQAKLMSVLKVRFQFCVLGLCIFNYLRETRLLLRMEIWNEGLNSIENRRDRRKRRKETDFSSFMSANTSKSYKLCIG